MRTAVTVLPALLLALAGVTAYAKPVRVPLEVVVNGQPKAGIVGWMEEGELWVASQDALALGIKNLPTVKTVAERPAVSVKTLGSLATFDEAELRLSIVLEAKDTGNATSVDLSRARNRTSPVTVANGLIFDYEVGAGQAGQVNVLDGVTRLHASFMGWQLLDQRTATLVDGELLHTPIRTTLRRDWPASGLRFDVGTLDQPEPGLSTQWGSLRGLSFSSMTDGNSSTNALRSSASLATAVRFPSTAEIYVNGVRQGSYDVKPGTFDVQGLRSFSAGNTQVRAVIRDLFGNETVLEESRYVGENTLRSGAQEFAYQLGTDPYSPEKGLQARATHKYGLTQALTLTAKAEARRSYAAAQLSAAAAVGSLGEISAGVMSGHSDEQAKPNGYFLSHQYDERAWSTLTTLLSRPEMVFQRTGLLASQNVKQLSTRQTWSLDSGDQLQASVALTRFDGNGQSRDLELGWSRKFGPSLFMQSFIRHNSLIGGSAQVLFTWVPGNGYLGTSFTSADKTGPSQQLTYSKNPAVGEYNWRLDSRVSKYDSAVGGSIEKDLELGSVKLNTSLSKLSSAARVSWRSGVMAGYGDVHIGRNNSNAAVVVDAAGLPGIGVFRNNSPVGVTDKNGLFWLANLPGYEEVRVSLDEAAIPLDRWYSGGEQRAVRPAPGSVVGVKFDIREVRSVAMVVKTCADCKPIADQLLQLSSEGGVELTAKLIKGVAKVDGLLTGRQRITTSDGACTGVVDVPKTGQVEVTLECAK